jgi:hypothetical protein
LTIPPGVCYFFSLSRYLGRNEDVFTCYMLSL